MAALLTRSTNMAATLAQYIRVWYGGKMYICQYIMGIIQILTKKIRIHSDRVDLHFVQYKYILLKQCRILRTTWLSFSRTSNGEDAAEQYIKIGMCVPFVSLSLWLHLLFICLLFTIKQFGRAIMKQHIVASAFSFKFISLFYMIILKHWDDFYSPLSYISNNVISLISIKTLVILYRFVGLVIITFSHLSIRLRTKTIDSWDGVWCYRNINWTFIISKEKII